MKQRIIEKLREVKGSGKRIHCLTNPISINFLANAVLSYGCKPVMAEYAPEVERITACADALYINLGNITEARMESMRRSFGVAKQAGIPVVLDVNGVSASPIRNSLAREFMEAGNVTVKGNASEILSLIDGRLRTGGVDSEEEEPAEVVSACRTLARAGRSRILASGARDILSDGRETYIADNGAVAMSMVTGTGCVQSGIVAMMLTAGEDLAAVAAATVLWGICGESASTADGYGYYQAELLKYLNRLTIEEITERMQLERLIQDVSG